MNKIKFVKNDNDMVYNPEKRKDTFYQFCQFKNPYTGEYGSRKVVFNELGSILKVYEKEYPAEKIETFIKKHNFNKYKMFPVNNIQYVEMPNANDMTELQSELLNNNVKSYGYQKV